MTEWKWSAGKQSIKGRLFALKDKKESATFIEFRMFWHPEKRKVITQAFGSGGSYAIGEMKSIGSKSEINIEHTVYIPNQANRRELVKEIGGKDEFRTEDFILQRGSWQPLRTYVWKRQK